MKIRTDRWWHRLFKLGLECSEKTEEGKVDSCAYAVIMLKGVGAVLFLLVGSVGFYAALLATNLMTILLGFGTLKLENFHRMQFAWIPFQFKWRGEQRSFAWLLTPLSAPAGIAATFWFYPRETYLIGFLVVAMIVSFGAVIVWEFVKEESKKLKWRCPPVEFIDPPQST